MVSEVLITGTSVVGALVTVIVISPWIAILFLPLLPAYEWVRRRYLATAREVKRLNSIAASPIFSNFGETLQVHVHCPSTVAPLITVGRSALSLTGFAVNVFSLTRRSANPQRFLSVCALLCIQCPSYCQCSIFIRMRSSED